jgi:hypothetical protein
MDERGKEQRRNAVWVRRGVRRGVSIGGYSSASGVRDN